MSGRPRHQRPPARGLGSLARDERGLVVSFFVRLAIVLAIVGLAAVETGAVIFARLQAQDVAETAASVAAGSFKQTRNQEIACQEAERAVADKDDSAKLTGCRVLQEGRVEVTVRKRASTVLVQHIGFLKGLRTARSVVVGEPPPV